MFEKCTLSLLSAEPPPSPPLNLMVTSSTLSSVTISWAAPLDTPLCVHSYTVTVRNSCNSSQVMVYNTTDNRSSLSITDLTSDGEYSVTVAVEMGQDDLDRRVTNYKFEKSYSACSIWLQCTAKKCDCIQWEVSIVTSFCENNAQSMLAGMYSRSGDCYNTCCGYYSVHTVTRRGTKNVYFR